MTMRLWLLCQAVLLGLFHVSCCASQYHGDTTRRLFVPPEQNKPTTVFQPTLAFPRLPDSRAPTQPGWNNSVAICTSVKNEKPQDLAEWVMYHKWRGIDHIGIVENNFTVTPELQEVLAPHVASGFVDFRAFGDDAPAQNRAFAACFSRMRENHDWVAFIDADEYIMLLDRSFNIKTLLNEYKEHPALALNWIMFGSSNRQRRPPGGGVLRWYMQCEKKPHRNIKVIANSYYVLSMDSHPHNFFYREDRPAVAEDFEPIAPRLPDQPRCDLPDDEVTGAAACRFSPGAENERFNELKRIALFHYVTKSWEDFEVKMVRGDGNSGAKDKKKPAQYYLAIQDETRAAGDICDEGILAWEQCCARGGPAPA